MTATPSYDIGDRPRTTWTVKLNGSVTDPPLVMLIVKSPTGAQQVSIFGELAQPHPITKDSVGVYHADIPLTEGGQWARRWIAFDELGVPLNALEKPFRVKLSHVTNPLGPIPP